MICIERLRRHRGGVELIGTPTNPYLATVGLRVEPAPVGSGVDFGLEVELGLDAARVLHRGRVDGRGRRCGTATDGWEIPDARVRMTALRLLGAAEPRPRHLRQVDVEHGRRLPRPDPAADGSGDRPRPARWSASRCTGSSWRCPRAPSGRCCRCSRTWAAYR